MLSFYRFAAIRRALESFEAGRISEAQLAALLRRYVEDSRCCR